MRVRFILPVLAVVALLSALVVVACGGEDMTAPAATDTPATAAPMPSGEGSGYVTVDVETAHAALAAHEDAQLVDVREPAEWAETGVPQGAVLIPLGELESRAADELTAGGPVYVICRSGNRSRTGSDILVGLGFADVYNVDGGVTAWVDAGLPVAPYQP
jgi:rhodanese-related sulfurtransferase